MFRAVIVEDEKPILDLMKVILGRNPHYHIVGAFTSPLEALECVPGLRPDVAFIDVEMPRMNGVELSHKLREQLIPLQIVFTTAYKHYALEAFDVQALDYVLKPVTPAAIERVTQRLQARSPSGGLQSSKEEVMPFIRCFGPFEVRNSEGKLVHFPTRKTEELLAYFLCHPGQEISKWHLADMLWPETLGDRSLHSLHNTIYRLKKVLKEQGILIQIQKTNDGYMLDAMDHTYDVLELSKHDFTLRSSLPPIVLAEALSSQYRGPLLEKKPYLWKSALEERYGKQFAALLRVLIGADLAGEDWSKAEQRLRHYLIIHPLDEEMNRTLLDLYVRLGETDKVIRHYQIFEEAYRKEIGLDPPQAFRDRVSLYMQ
ncbi:response regulator [Paenibacillus filicis]|uniref:Response regulator n=1 Tax=Paenibacillus filicis TaxID=669464 RepID=A0ABU9DQJ5_9BACL